MTQAPPGRDRDEEALLAELVLLSFHGAVEHAADAPERGRGLLAQRSVVEAYHFAAST
jgi:hypothetical protein